MESDTDTIALEATPRREQPDRGARPLRIGLMLRGIDEYDGAGVYIRKLCDALFELDPDARSGYWPEYEASLRERESLPREPSFADYVAGLREDVAQLK